MYRISRNCAVLLGETREESLEIFSNIKSICDARSKIIHRGDKSGLDLGQLNTLRYYIRKSIIKMMEINEPKDALLRKLSILGFGEIGNYDSVVL